MATFLYYCKVCGSQAKKEPTKKNEHSDATLGTWHCTGSCKGAVSVQRNK